MESNQFYNELRVKYQTEDRAKLIMLQLKTYQEQKKQRKWWQKIGAMKLRNIQVKPKSWDD
jgi:CRISPR/Cas system-associated endonuclease Cas1